MGKAQCISCQCGKMFAVSLEPYCYTDKEWKTDLGKYVKKGCTVEVREAKDTRLENCDCPNVNGELKKQIKLEL